jgi:yecA family protein
MSFIVKSSLSTSKSKGKSFAPLSDDELESLEALLASLDTADLDGEVDEARLSLSLDAVDGLFAAMALSPRQLAIGQWMPLVMGSAQFADKVQTQLCRNLLIRHQQSVAHQLRHTELEHYYPCITVNEEADAEDEDMDVQAWCAGFALGYEQQQEAWDARLDDIALTDLTLILALKDGDAINDAESEAEVSFREAQSALIDLMRAELSELLQEPADDLSLLLFSLQSLQSRMLKAVADTANLKQNTKQVSSRKPNNAARSSTKK